MSKGFVEKSRTLPVVGDYDVIVAGAGVAGTVAAVAAARQGAKTLLIERYGFLGGTLVSCPMPMIGGYNPAVHKGITSEIIELLRARDGVNREFYNEIIGGQMIEARLDVFKEISLALLQAASGDVLLHTWIAGAIVENSKIKGVLVESKSGRQAIMAKVVIDTTGDGDVAAFAGASFGKGREADGKMQGMTLYGPIMDGVDIERLLSYIRNYRKDHPTEIKEFIDEGNVFAMSGFPTLIAQAREAGFQIPYNMIWINGKKDCGWAELSGSFVADADGTDAASLTRAEIESAKQISSMVAFARKFVPGFEKSVRRDRGSVCIGVRETRRIVGDYMLTLDDLMQQRKFDDVIGRNSTSVDIHLPEGKQKWIQLKPYDIPYRSLISKDIPNLMMAGRCISATHEALASVRFIPCCMVTGEAAGTGAAMAVKGGVAPKDIDIPQLQAVLSI